MIPRDDDPSDGTPVKREARSAPETTNRKVWAHVGQVARFASAQGWIDRSECAILKSISNEYVGGDVLDVGVGGGRTVPLLSPSAARYVGIDFVPELVTAANKRFPDADIRVGDARHLDFPDESFDLAVFSINGIDAISHSDRAIALREIRRVLRPTGAFVFSTHNSEGPGPRERPGPAATSRAAYWIRFSHASQLTFLKNASTYLARSVAR